MPRCYRRDAHGMTQEQARAWYAAGLDSLAWLWDARDRLAARYRCAAARPPRLEPAGDDGRRSI